MPGNEVAKEAGGRGALERPVPHAFGLLLMQGKRLRRRRDHGNAHAHIGLFAEAERAEREDLAVGLAKDRRREASGVSLCHALLAAGEKLGTPS